MAMLNSSAISSLSNSFVSYPYISLTHGTNTFHIPRLPRRYFFPRCEVSTESRTEGRKSKRTLFDNASNYLTNFLSGSRIGSMPIAEGAVSDLFGKPLFISLYDWFIEHGSVYKLAFGPKSFLVVSDPIVARHILRENAFAYDKGVLADILEPIMGKGLIPADLETWKPRRKDCNMAPNKSTSEAWKHVTKNGPNKAQCNLCPKVITGSLTRVMDHLLGITAGKGGGVTACPGVTQELRAILEKEHSSSIAQKMKNAQKKQRIEDVPRFTSTIPSSSCLPQVVKPTKESGTLNSFWKPCEKQVVDDLLADLFYTSAIPFNVARNPLYRVVFQKVGEFGKGYIPPSSEALRTTLLERSKDRVTDKLAVVKASWKVTGCTILSDGCHCTGFHAAFLEAMVKVFGDCSERTVKKLEAMLLTAQDDKIKHIEMDMEAEFSSLALDIIGLCVFNYDFGSVTRESPVIKAVYGTLFEAEHRSTFYIPYWKFPLARWLVPRQRKFHEDLKVINECLDNLITSAKATRQEDDIEALQGRDYSQVKDTSLLRFLVDMKEKMSMINRDDLMTMLIAGHETTAAVLTWAVFMLAQNPDKLVKAQSEVDVILGQRKPTFECIKKLQYIRLIIAEALRLYPQPPLLIRRALQPDTLPGGYRGDKEGYLIPQGTDIFISVYNLHRSPYLWDNPHKFEPERFLVPKENKDIEGWAGFSPYRNQGALYPNEVISDFAFLPFGGGPRKCVGDQFALMEATVGLAMLLQKFDLELKGSPESVQIVTGATIHTKNGLWCKIKRREGIQLENIVS